MSGFIVLLIAAAFAFQAWVTWRVWRSDLFQRNQKVAQSQLIWIVPVIGAMIVQSILSEDDTHDRGDSNGNSTLPG